MNHCHYNPRLLVGVPLGQFHCPLCLEMVVAGLPHPDYSLPLDHLLLDSASTLTFAELAGWALTGEEPRQVVGRGWRSG